MRHLPLVSLFVVTVMACAPATRPAEISPEAIEGGKRYQLVYVTLGSASVDRKVVDEVGVEIQQELAHKGLLLAAPWETPTLLVRYSLRGATEERFDVRSSGTPFDVGDAGSVMPVSYSRTYSDCDGSKESTGHCSALDAPKPSMPLSARIGQRHRSLAVEVRDLQDDHVVWAGARSDDGEWTRARALRIRPLVQATLTQASF